MHESVQKGETRPTSQQLQTLLEVAEAIVSNRELSAVVKNLAGLLHRVARFGHPWLNLRDGADDTVRLNVMEPADPGPPVAPLPVQDLAKWVWQNQLPVVTSFTSQAERWPDYYQWAQRLNMNSLCVLPLTTMGRRLGALGFGCKQPGAYDGREVDFLHLVANQVAVAVDNALKYQDALATQQDRKSTRDR